MPLGNMEGGVTDESYREFAKADVNPSEIDVADDARVDRVSDGAWVTVRLFVQVYIEEFDIDSQ